jgi:hypothetical protein
MHPALQPVCGEKTWQPAYDPVNNVTVVVDHNSATWVYRYKKAVVSVLSKKSPDLALRLEVSPNPMGSQAVISFPGARPPIRLSVCDIRGQQVGDLTTWVHGNRAVWNTGGLAPALYTVKLESGTGVLFKRAAKVR